jgi:Spy/CpxP family protein refolding chaperone
MSPTRLSRVALAVLLLALAAPVHAQSFGFPWWKDTQIQRDLTLTAEQTAKIDAIFQSTISLLRQKKEELDRQEDELSKLIATGADESLVTRQVDKVESIRANMNKMRTLMLLHERQVLTPDQRVRLNKLHEQMEKDRGRSRGERKELGRERR